MKRRFWDRVVHLSVWFSFNLLSYWASPSPFTPNCICSFQYHSAQCFQSKHHFFLQRRGDQFSHGVRGRTFKESVLKYQCACSVAQLCLTLCYPMDYSPSGSSVHGISQAEYWSGLPFPTPGIEVHS